VTDLLPKLEDDFTEEEKRGVHPIMFRLVREIRRLSHILQLWKAAETPDSFVTRGNIAVGSATQAVQLSGFVTNRSTIVISNTGANAISIVSGEQVQQGQGFTIAAGSVLELEVKEAVWAYESVSGSASTVDVLETRYNRTGVK
jgi:hypothetical protein